MTLVLKLLIDLINLFTILIALSPISKPTRLEEAQLIKPLSNGQTIYLSFAIMASNSCSCRNAQQASARSNQPKKAIAEITLTPSTTNTPSQTLASAPALTLYTYKDLQRITKLCTDLFL